MYLLVVEEDNTVNNTKKKRDSKESSSTISNARFVKNRNIFPSIPSHQFPLACFSHFNCISIAYLLMCSICTYTFVIYDGKVRTSCNFYMVHWNEEVLNLFESNFKNYIGRLLSLIGFTYDYIEGDCNYVHCIQPFNFNDNVKENIASLRDEIGERSTETFAWSEQKRKDVDVKCISDEFTGTSHSIAK